MNDGFACVCEQVGSVVAVVVDTGAGREARPNQQVSRVSHISRPVDRQDDRSRQH